MYYFAIYLLHYAVSIFPFQYDESTTFILMAAEYSLEMYPNLFQQFPSDICFQFSAISSILQ